MSLKVISGFEKLLNWDLFCLRLELISNRPKEQASRIFTSVVEDDFAFELINELGKAFLRAEDRTAQVEKFSN